MLYIAILAKHENRGEHITGSVCQLYTHHWDAFVFTVLYVRAVFPVKGLHAY